MASERLEEAASAPYDDLSILRQCISQRGQAGNSFAECGPERCRRLGRGLSLRPGCGAEQLSRMYASVFTVGLGQMNFRLFGTGISHQCPESPFRP